MVHHHVLDGISNMHPPRTLSSLPAWNPLTSTTKCAWLVSGTHACIVRLSIMPLGANNRHSINEIASQLSPAPQCTGIELLQADTFDVHCFQTLTGTKFVIVSERHTPDVDELLRTTYVPLTFSGCTACMVHSVSGI